MIFQIPNPTLSGYEYYDTYNEAMEQLMVYQTNLLAEPGRFTVAKEIVNGNDTTWMSADLDNDSEDYTYQVFNHLTGKHEKVGSLTQAKNRVAQIKQEYLVSLSMVEPISMEQRPEPQVWSATSTGTQTL